MLFRARHSELGLPVILLAETLTSNKSAHRRIFIANLAFIFLCSLFLDFNGFWRGINVTLTVKFKLQILT